MVDSRPPNEIVTLLLQGDSRVSEIDPEISLNENNEGRTLVIRSPLRTLFVNRVDTPFNFDIFT